MWFPVREAENAVIRKIAWPATRNWLINRKFLLQTVLMRAAWNALFELFEALYSSSLLERLYSNRLLGTFPSERRRSAECADRTLHT